MGTLIMRGFQGNNKTVVGDFRDSGISILENNSVLLKQNKTNSRGGVGLVIAIAEGI